MDFSKVSYSEVSNKSAELKSAASQMEALLEEVRAEYNKIDSEGVWAGDAAGKIRAEFDRLSAKFPEFSQAVNECATYLDGVVANYQAADQAIIQ